MVHYRPKSRDVTEPRSVVTENPGDVARNKPLTLVYTPSLSDKPSTLRAMNFLVVTTVNIKPSCVSRTPMATIVTRAIMTSATLIARRTPSRTRKNRDCPCSARGTKSLRRRTISRTPNDNRMITDRRAPLRFVTYFLSSSFFFF